VIDQSSRVSAGVFFLFLFPKNLSSFFSSDGARVLLFFFPPRNLSLSTTYSFGGIVIATFLPLSALFFFLFAAVYRPSFLPPSPPPSRAPPPPLAKKRKRQKTIKPFSFPSSLLFSFSLSLPAREDKRGRERDEQLIRKGRIFFPPPPPKSFPSPPFP